MVLTDLQRSKLAVRFDQLDADHDGFIQQSDLATVAQRLCDLLVPAKLAKQRTAVLEGYQELWRQLSAGAGTGGDSRISREQYVNAVGTGLASDPKQFERSIKRITTALFEALDSNGDGHLDTAEVTRMATALGMSQSDSAALFTKLDADGDGKVTDTELQVAISAFYHSDDPDSVGSFVFGRVS